jgi:DNA-binding NtrC family response regulator
MRILIVDDEIEICQRLKRELEKEGYSVDYETSSSHALKKLKEAKKNNKPFHLLLLNIQMPEINGLSLLSHIRKERLGIEVIIISGYRDEKKVIEAIRLKARDYLKKPISLNELDTVVFRVEELLKKQELYNILVVDDERELARLVKRELEKEGWRVKAAYSAEECLNYFKGNKIDVLITDIKMPKMDGLEMLEKCREITDDFVSIIITGHGDYEKAMKALKLGAFNYLKKPFSLDELIISVKEGIEQLNIHRFKKVGRK